MPEVVSRHAAGYSQIFFSEYLLGLFIIRRSWEWFVVYEPELTYMRVKREPVRRGGFHVENIMPPGLGEPVEVTLSEREQLEADKVYLGVIPHRLHRVSQAGWINPIEVVF